jgi:hypothetical protein
MTKLFRASSREYQRSPVGAPNGTLSNALPRTTSNNGEFIVTSETTRARLQDLSASFDAATHEGRLLYFPYTTANTPPAAGTSGTRLHNGWFFRIKTVISPTVIELEGFRAEYAGTGITYVIVASVDFTAATAIFPEDTGPTGTNADGEDRTNTGPVEWQAISFLDAADSRLNQYPFWVTKRIGATQLRLSDPFDNTSLFPAPVSNLKWFLRDRPAYTHHQLYKIIHQCLLHCGFRLEQHRGKNNGVGVGGNNTNVLFNVEDMVYFTDGEDGKQTGYLRFLMNHRHGNADGTDNNGKAGFDFAWWSKWQRDYASLAIPGTTATTNQGNGINSLGGQVTSVSFPEDGFAAIADRLNNGNSSSIGPYFCPANVPIGTQPQPFHSAVRWNPAFAFSGARDIKNTFNTPEGGDIAEVRYYFFGSKDEIHIYLEAPGFGVAQIGMGFFKTRPDAQGNNFKTNFSTPNGNNVLLRIGGPGTGNGTDPTTTTPPYQIGDRIQTVGQRINTTPLIVPGTSHPGEFIDSSQITNLPGLVEAVGILICDTVANITDGSTFTINDGLGFANSIQIYEFNKTGGVGGGNVAVDLITGSPTTADQVRDRIRDAVNPLVTANYTWNGSTTVTTPDTSEVAVGDWIRLANNNTNKLFRITAINPNVSVTIENPDGFIIPTGSGANTTRRSRHGIWATNAVSARVDLNNGRKGGHGNILIVDAGQEFLTGTEGMGGGGYAIEIATLANPLAAGALVGEDPQPMFIFRPSVIGTPFSSTGGTQGIFRVSNRSAHGNATYKDYSGPAINTAGAGSWPTALGFDALAELSGMFGPDTREINPNERSGRFPFVAVSCRDTVGGQIRGSMRYLRVGSPRVSCFGLRKDRLGQYHMLLPFAGRQVSFGTETTSNELITALGPMPAAMAIVG